MHGSQGEGMEGKHMWVCESRRANTMRLCGRGGGRRRGRVGGGWGRGREAFRTAFPLITLAIRA